jgi:peptidoglycan hydrolase-like protein with peptidoglycan-binding domain
MSQREQQDVRDRPLIGGIPVVTDDLTRRRRQPLLSIRSRRLWGGLALLLILLSAGIVFGPRLLLRPAAKSSASSTRTTATVVRRDLAQRQRVDGTLGYDGSFNVASQYTAPASDATLTQLQHAFDAAQTAYNTAVSKANLQSQIDANTVSTDQTKLNDDQKQLSACKQQNPTNAQVCSTLQQSVTQDQSSLSKDQDQQKLDKVNSQQAVEQARAAMVTAQDNLNNPNSGSGAAAAGSTVYVTWLPNVGDTVDRGQTMFRANGRPIPLFFGNQIFSSTLKPGVSGDDVRVLEENLLALGYNANGALTADGTFSSTDTDAVSAWQKALGVKVTGVVNTGDVVILPGAARIQKLAASTGAAIQAGAPVLTATSTNPVVTVKLNASLQTVVGEGDPSDVTLPNQKIVHGKITSIAKVADAAAAANASPTVNVLIKLDSTTGAGNLDQAPVTVNIIPQSRTVKAALAVPIAALVAGQGGGYALEVLDSSGRTHFVTVQTGVFDDADGLVQVTGAGIGEGTKIVMPAIS